MFHLTPYCGRASGPNDFFFYKDEYHLFYQYIPYDLCCDPTHVGHAVSSTLFDWRHLPAEMGTDIDYEKHEEPVTDISARFGSMYECSDFFELSGTWVLLLSSMEMKSCEPDDHSGSAAIFGDYDRESGIFTPHLNQPIDYGTDFCFPRTLLTPDGRRILIACMQNRDIRSDRERTGQWAGQMTIPRELSVTDGRLCQNPARELEQYYTNILTYKNVPVSDEVFLYGMEGSCVDIEINVRPVTDEPLYREFSVCLAADDESYSSICFSPEDGMVKIGRKHSGSPERITHHCGCLVEESMDGNIKFRIILDRFSSEVFINDGRYVVSTVIPTRLSAEKFIFRTEGKSAIDVTKRDIHI
jgi:beta-fructofuranosidase